MVKLFVYQLLLNAFSYTLDKTRMNRMLESRGLPKKNFYLLFIIAVEIFSRWPKLNNIYSIGVKQRILNYIT